MIKDRTRCRKITKLSARLMAVVDKKINGKEITIEASVFRSLVQVSLEEDWLIQLESQPSSA